VTQAASVARILPPFWKFSLPTAPVNAILTTPTGMLWAAVENGLVSIDGDQVSFLTRENGLFPAPSATCLAHDGTSLWVGTFEGLYKLSSGGSFEKFTTQEGLAHDMVWSLEWDGRILWVGTQAGFSFSLPDGRFERIDDKISNGGLADVWVKSIRRFERWTLCGNDEGVSVWDTAIAAANPSGWVTMDMFSTNLPHSFILTQLVAENQIWAGTPMGLSRLEIPVDKLFGGVVASWKTFNRSNGLPDNRVDALALAGRDLWVGTPAGLARYRSGLFRNMGYADGLLASDVRALHVAGDRLWVGTSGGFQALDFAAVN
jgi:ligand-binding sensor domain-containing protein